MCADMLQLGVGGQRRLVGAVRFMFHVHCTTLSAVKDRWALPGVLWLLSIHEPAVCAGCQEGQWDPVVHQEECGQQVEGGSPSPLLCPSEAPSGVPCPVLRSPVQERWGTTGESPAEGYEDDETTGASLLRGKWKKRRLSGVVSMDSPRGNHAWPIW